MTKKKFNLGTLQVQSFVTKNEWTIEKTIKGGGGSGSDMISAIMICNSYTGNCEPSRSYVPRECFYL